MTFYIENAIDNHSLLAIQESISDKSLFSDGNSTAGKSAGQVKYNLQANSLAQSIVGVTKLIEGSLLKHELVKSVAYPKRFAKTMISRYEQNMHYGEHIDEAFINNARTDLAFTLFISEPNSYDGGELEITKSDGRDTIKLPAGSAYIYPANTIHQVLPVTKGVRLAAVGWIQSRVRCQHQREILFDLTSAIGQIANTEQQATARLGLLKTRSNLERLWCD